MTQQSEWQSSHVLQQLLKSLGCEITQNSNSNFVDIYRRKNEKLVTMQSSGKLPPQQVRLIMTTLGFN